jgi:hypothetical protein
MRQLIAAGTVVKSIKKSNKLADVASHKEFNSMGYRADDARDPNIFRHREVIRVIWATVPTGFRATTPLRVRWQGVSGVDARCSESCEL